MVLVGIEQPVEPGQFVGDIWYGHPEHRTMGTHKWTGEQWEAMASGEEVLVGLLAQARQRAEYWKAEHLAANAEISRLRADLANAGAVMVEAHISRAASTSREVFADSCNHTMQAIDYMEQLLLSALSTPSPIAAAAGLVADGIDADMRTFNQCLDEEPATGETKAGHFLAQVMRRYARAIAEQEKADG